jgi:D-arabinose 5-phosphate isomerase GutQ
MYIFTAEHAETAEVISAMARPKDIFFSFSLSGAASRLFGFLSALRDLRGE